MTPYVIRRVLTGMLILVLLSMFTFLIFNGAARRPGGTDVRQVLQPADHRGEPRAARP